MVSDQFAGNRENFCYRHPKRQSFVLCQRCTRTICAECQTQAPVGVICPECMKEQQRSRPSAVKRAQRRWRGFGGPVAVAGGKPLAVMWIAIVTAVAYVLSLLQMVIPGFSLQNLLAFYAPALYPQLGLFQPWRLFTVALVHGGFVHIALNLLALWLIGRILEPMIGHLRFVLLYLIATLGGSVAAALLAFDQPVVGASGAVFGLLGALLVIGRRLGRDITGILIVLGINLVLGFVLGNVSWQAHVGGLVAGMLVGLVYAGTRRRSQRGLQIAGLVAVTAGLCALLLLPPVIHGF